MDLLDKFLRNIVQTFVFISGIILFIGIIFLGFGNDDIFLQILGFTIKTFTVLISLTAIKILLGVLFKRMKEKK